MPRKSRNQLVGNFFHVMIQGINKEFIFEKDIYKKKYLEIVSKYAQKNNIKIVAYCVMSNHVHLLVHIESVENLSRCMHDTNTDYGKYYNFANNRVGFVFRNRYHTQEIMNEKHLMACVTYIHRNPVKAEMVKHESQYKYSSYNEYLKKNKIISNESIELLFGTTNKDEYIADFIKLHETGDKYFFIDDKIDYEKVIEDYKNSNLTNDEIVINLRRIYNLSERKISELLKISRYYIRNILEKKV